MPLHDELRHLFGERLRENVALAPYTTFRVGGNADLFVEPRSAHELTTALATAARWAIPVTLLGGGSNVLVADAGVRGLVIHPRHGTIDSPERDVVRAETAVTINGLVRWTIARGLAGLEAWAGTPGTVGGGIYGNAHFRGRLLSEHVLRVGLASPDGVPSIAPASAMGFGYDRSRLQSTGEVVLWAEFGVRAGDPGELRDTARASLAYRKGTQPLHLPSAGCVFQNPDDRATLPEGVPRSAGALLDRAGLKGLSRGGARVSPVHANFIVNEGGATAEDLRALIEHCRTEVFARFGVRLLDEIVYLGDFARADPPSEADERCRR